ncbi:MAG: class I tRNA ligase family protein, partial [Candidatus Eremiobacteraeota bacterium]|nr:class I tRNA ligase family protein [Candidatus Eremiobacteraeota bacterium]
AYLQIVEFESAMSSLFFDALKDPLYTRAVGDARRRSAQSALLHVLARLLTVIAPVLSFTAEEAWQSLPPFVRERSSSVFDTSFDAGRPRGAGADDDFALWQLLRDLRARVAATASPRDYEAQLRLTVTPSLHKRLRALGDNLREALIVSHLDLRQAEGGEGAGDVLGFELKRAEGEKCARCWKYRTLGSDPAHPTICEDCAHVVRGLEPIHAPQK